MEALLLMLLVPLIGWVGNKSWEGYSRARRLRQQKRKPLTVITEVISTHPPFGLAISDDPLLLGTVDKPQDLYALLVTAGAVPYNRLYLKFLLGTEGPEPVHVRGAEVMIESRQPATKFATTVWVHSGGIGGSGWDNALHLVVDLDERTPVAYVGEWPAEPGEPPKSTGRPLSFMSGPAVRQDDPQTVMLWTMAQQPGEVIAFRVDLAVLVDGTASVITLDNDGRPFELVSGAKGATSLHWINGSYQDPSS